MLLASVPSQLCAGPGWTWFQLGLGLFLPEGRSAMFCVQGEDNAHHIGKHMWMLWVVLRSADPAKGFSASSALSASRPGGYSKTADPSWVSFYLNPFTFPHFTY